MKRRVPTGLLVTLLAVFIAGGVAGSVLTTHLIRKQFRKSLQFENWAANTEESLSQKLAVTPEQRPQVHTIILESEREFAAIFKRTLREAGEVIVRTGRNLDAILTPEQRLIHGKLKADLRKHLKSELQMELPPE